MFNDTKSEESFHAKLQNMDVHERCQVVLATVVEYAVLDIKRYGEMDKPDPQKKLSKDVSKRQQQVHGRKKYQELLSAKAFIFGKGSTLDWYCRRIGISPAMIRRKMKDYLTEGDVHHERTTKQEGRSTGRYDSHHLGSNGV